MKDLQCKLLYLIIKKQTDSFKRKHSYSEVSARNVALEQD